MTKMELVRLYYTVRTQDELHDWIRKLEWCTWEELQDQLPEELKACQYSKDEISPLSIICKLPASRYRETMRHQFLTRVKMLLYSCLIGITYPKKLDAVETIAELIYAKTYTEVISG